MPIFDEKICSVGAPPHVIHSHFAALEIMMKLVTRPRARRLSLRSNTRYKVLAKGKRRHFTRDDIKPIGLPPRETRRMPSRDYARAMPRADGLRGYFLFLARHHRFIQFRGCVLSSSGSIMSRRNAYVIMDRVLSLILNSNLVMSIISFSSIT